MHYDVIIVGTGAGGGSLARRLAGSGKRILLLERGDFLPREHENWDPELVSAGRYRPGLTWHDQDGQPFSPYTHYWVGGNTKVYGAALFRLREADFGEVQHADGVSPAWPLDYADLRPYYLEAEHWYSVHGVRGADPTEPPESEPLPWGPLDHEPRIAKLNDDLRAQGWRPFPAPIGLRLPTDGAEGRAAVVNLSRFDGYPDPTTTKADAEVCGVLPALQHDNVAIVTRACVTRLVTDASGRTVTSVVADVDGSEQVFEGDVVVVACGAIQTAALLLRSASDAHPGGLANRSDQVGRNYMAHNNGTLIAVSDVENPSRFQKTLAVTDFYHHGPDGGHPLGMVQLMGRSDRASLQAARDEAGLDLPVERFETHGLDFFLTAEDLPRPDNRVTLAPDGTIRLAYHANNLAAYQGLHDVLVEALQRTGCHTACHLPSAYVGGHLAISGVSHQNGTARMGTDPATSVVDRFCKAHDVDNLYIVDGSVFPSCGAVNPSLTIIANALRVGDHLLERLG